ncbi:T9SS type A sorting domain-containing protein [candidate division KSB1 bacterium]
MFRYIVSITITLFSFLLLPHTSKTQESWVRAYGSETLFESPKSVNITPDNGFIITGWITSENSLYQVKTDASGLQDWENFITVDYPHQISPNFIENFETGEFILISRIEDNDDPFDDSSDIFILKINEAGDILHEEMIDIGFTDRITEFKRVSANEFVLGGYAENENGDSSNVYLAYINDQGELTSKRVLPAIYREELDALDVTLDGGVILIGERRGTEVPYDLRTFLIKIRSGGLTDWSRSYNNSYLNNIHKIRLTSQGDYIVLRGTYKKLYLVKLDPQGNILWQSDGYDFENSYQPFGSSLLETSNGGFAYIGSIRNQRTTTYGEIYEDNNLLLVKTDQNGHTLWAQNIGGIENEYSKQLLQLSDDSFLILGRKNYLDHPDQDIILIKTSVDGISPVFPEIPIILDHGFFPNPFHSKANFFINLAEPRIIEIEIFTVRGRIVYKTEEFWFNRSYNKLSHVWSGLERDRLILPSGVYFYRITTNNGETATGKVTFIK